jgi:hypothetical protein
MLAAGLLIAVSGRPTQTPQSWVQGIGWQPMIRVSATKLDFGPYLATAGGRLFMIGSILSPVRPGDTASHGEVDVWSSADGGTWDLVSDPNSFGGPKSEFVPLGLSDDGKGGLVAVGNSSSPQGAAMAWHSGDGHTWTQEQLGGSGPGELIGVAARPGAIVAFGRELGGSLVAGFSADGSSWRVIVLPDSAGYYPRTITAWQGGFAAVAVYQGVATAAPTPVASNVWTSTDGLAWEKASMQLTGFDATAMAALGNSVVAVGSRSDERGMSPASWRSTDGRTWVESTAPPTQPATAFSDVAVVDGTLVAIGVRNTAVPASTPRPGSTPLPTLPASVWISPDGSTWRLLVADPSLVVGDWLHTHIASLGRRIVVATDVDGGVAVFVGS